MFSCIILQHLLARIILSTWNRVNNSLLLINISVISWRSVLLGEEIGVPGENHRLAASHSQTLTHNVLSSTPRLSVIRAHNISDYRH
jgi:hypothetical protein